MPASDNNKRADHGFGQRQRHLAEPDGVQDRRGGAPGLPAPAGGFTRQREREAVVDRELPQPVVERAVFDPLARGLVDLLGEQALRALFDRIGIGAHRKSNPLAMMPRRISRVPPRSENDGAASVV